MAIRSSDVSDWLTVFTQSALCFTFFFHYGLVKAVNIEIEIDLKYIYLNQINHTATIYTTLNTYTKLFTFFFFFR